MQGQIQSAQVKYSRKNQPYSNVQINGQWFNVFDNGRLAGFGAGATVTFDTIQNGQYTNMAGWQCNGQNFTALPPQGGGGGNQGAPRGNTTQQGNAAPAPARVTKSATELLLEFASPILAAWIANGGDAAELSAVAGHCREAAQMLRVTAPQPPPAAPPPKQQEDFDDDIPF